ncbi:MAG: M23 family metallopeptidase [Deltaproteobacteria bacterium]|nr:M23 family metallopeptidase [Deltaproteobacteria bacterium]
MSRLRSLAVAVLLLAVGLPAVWNFGGRRFLAWWEAARTLVSLRLEASPNHLPVPVGGVRPGRLVDSWGAPRSGHRRHQGIDIFAPRGRPVQSATRGIVLFVGEDRLGGHVVRVLGPGWDVHYYAHLDRFADVSPGEVVACGDLLGYVGDSGNARGTPCHLHYGIYTAGRGARNPYPLLAEIPALRPAPSPVL